MRKWFLPLTVLGLGSLGLLLTSEKGRRMIGVASDRTEDAREPLAELKDQFNDEFAEWNAAFEREIANLQVLADSVAKNLTDKSKHAV